MDLLGMSAHPSFRFCLTLDRGTMLSCDAQTTDKVCVWERWREESFLWGGGLTLLGSVAYVGIDHHE